MTQPSTPGRSEASLFASLPAPAFHDPGHHLRIYLADCLELLPALPESSVDLIFADPPYFLSNGGITCHAGKMVSVHKGDWDKSRGPDANHAFNTAWLAAAQRVLKPNGSIWVSGTAHVIHSVGFAMQQLGFKLLNDISWVKPNPPPNLSCRYFTHATETIIWAAKNARSRHTFHYKLMKETNRGKQMKSVWEIKPPGAVGKALRQAPHAKARRPPRAHPPRLLQRRRPRPRPLLRLRHHRPRRPSAPPSRSRLRTLRRLSRSLFPSHLFQPGTRPPFSLFLSLFH